MESSLQAFMAASATLARQCRNSRQVEFELQSFDEAYLKLGSLFLRDPFSKDERRALLKVLPLLNFNPKLKECYYNATHMARNCMLEFAEGKATSLIPVDHAWCVFEGRAVDVTWRHRDDRARTSPRQLMKRIERNIAESVYWGFCVPERWLWGHHLRTGVYSPAVDDPPNYEILKQGKLPWKEE